MSSEVEEGEQARVLKNFLVSFSNANSAIAAWQALILMRQRRRFPLV